MAFRPPGPSIPGGGGVSYYIFAIDRRDLGQPHRLVSDHIRFGDKATFFTLTGRRAMQLPSERAAREWIDDSRMELGGWGLYPVPYDSLYSHKKIEMFSEEVAR